MADNFLVSDAQRAAAAEGDLGFRRYAEVVELSSDRRAERLRVEKAFDRDQSTTQGWRGSKREDLGHADSYRSARNVELLAGQREQLADVIGFAAQDQPAAVPQRQLAIANLLAANRMDGNAVRLVQQRQHAR